MRAKRLVWEGNRAYAFADWWYVIASKKRHRGAAPKFRAWISDGEFVWQEHLYKRHATFNTEEEAKAACQQEFDRIWREMTDAEGST